MRHCVLTPVCVVNNSNMLLLNHHLLYLVLLISVYSSRAVAFLIALDSVQTNDDNNCTISSVLL